MTNGALNSILNSSSVFGTDNSGVTRVLDTVKNEDEQDFASVLRNVITGSLTDTQNLIDQAEQAEVEFMIGQSDNLEDLMITQSKASMAVNYVVAVRDRFLEAYKEIMNMQI